MYSETANIIENMIKNPPIVVAAYPVLESSIVLAFPIISSDQKKISIPINAKKYVIPLIISYLFPI